MKWTQLRSRRDAAAPIESADEPSADEGETATSLAAFIGSNLDTILASVIALPYATSSAPSRAFSVR